jgi:two-component SAPR family response regulator
MDIKGILFIEDDQAIRESLAKIMKDAEVVLDSKRYFAKDIKTAKQILNTHKIDLVFSDISLKGNTSSEMGLFLRKVNKKGQKLILYTGIYGDKYGNKNLPKLKEVPVLYKQNSGEREILTTIFKTLEENELQVLKEGAIKKLTNAKYHITSATEKYIARLIDKLKEASKERKKEPQLLIELYELRKMIQNLKNNDYNKKEMNTIMDKYKKVEIELEKLKTGIQKPKIKKIKYRRINLK